ncbi:MAG: LEA/WHy family protein [Candidatus Latescibacterota bacterium]
MHTFQATDRFHDAQRRISARPAESLIFLLVFSLALSCSGVREAVDVARPEIDLQSVEIQNLTFETVDLVFNVGVRNPNNIPIRLSRLDYTLFLNDRQFLKGDRGNSLHIEANSTATVDIPLTVHYDTVYSTYRTLAGQDSVPYRAEIGLYFNLPALGDVRVPVTRRGYLPLVQSPRVNVESVEIESIRPTGADLILHVLLDNPNGFSLLMRRLTYDFLVSDRTWAAGTTREEVRIDSGSRSAIEIPMSINFLSVGQSVYRILIDSQALNYRFRGNILFQSPHPLIKEINFPFDITGKAEIER